MVANSFEIPRGLPGLNDIIRASKKHWGTYSSMKKLYNELISSCIIGADCVPPAPYKTIDVTCVWIENGKKRDPDNVMAGIKFILDAMVQTGVIVDDTRDIVRCVSHTIIIGDKRSVNVHVQPVCGDGSIDTDFDRRTCL